MENEGKEAADRAEPRLTLRAFCYILGVFCGSRLLILFAAQIARMAFIKDRFYVPADSFIELFMKWDSIWYLNVAVSGYDYPADNHSNVVFYPLYPLIIRAVAQMGMDPILAGYVISNAALFGACLILWKLAALEWKSESIANRAVLLLLICPGSFWFSIGYAEAVFVLLLAACLYLCRRRYWLCAGMAGFGVALTRTPGLLAGVFLAVEAVAEWFDYRATAGAAPAVAQVRIAWWRRLVAVFAPAFGYFGYMAFLKYQFGDWMAQQKALAAGWQDTGFDNPWRHFLGQMWMDEPFLRWICYPMLIAAAALCGVSGWATRRWSYPALSAAFLALYLTTANYSRLPRYLVVVVPFFLVAAWLCDKARILETSIVAVSVLLLTLLVALQVSGYHIN